MDWNKVREKNNQQTVENTDSTFDWSAIRKSRNRQKKKPHSVKSVYSNTPQREELLRNIEANTVYPTSKEYESSRYLPRTGEELIAGLNNHLLAEEKKNAERKNNYLSSTDEQRKKAKDDALYALKLAQETLDAYNVESVISGDPYGYGGIDELNRLKSDVASRQQELEEFSEWDKELIPERSIEQIREDNSKRKEQIDNLENRILEYERERGGNFSLYDREYYDMTEQLDVLKNEYSKDYNTLWFDDKATKYRWEDYVIRDDWSERSKNNPDITDSVYRGVNTPVDRNTYSGKAEWLPNWNYMSNGERGIYNYLYSEDNNKAQEYLDYLEYLLNQRKAEDVAVETSEYAKEHPFAASLESVGLNLTSGIGAIDLAVQDIKNQLSDERKPLDYNSRFQTPSKQSSTIRGTVSEEYFGGGTIGKIYQLGMSMLDSAAIAGLTATGIPGGTLLLGGSAATSTMQEAKQRGLSDDQALSLGLFAGVAETFFEKYSIDSLFNLESPKTLKDVLKNAVRQAIPEGYEEGMTTIVNTAADILIAGDKSELMQRKNELLNLGYSEKEANIIAGGEWVKGLAEDVIGGMVSGGIFGGATYVANVINSSVSENSYYENIYGENLPELINEALELDPENKLAQKLKAKIDNGKNVYGRQIAQLINQNELNITDDVIDEQETDNINHEQTTFSTQEPANTEKTDTNRINVDEYSRLVQDAEITQENTTQTTTADNTEVPKAAQTTVNQVVNTSPDEVTETTQSSKPTAAVNETVDNVETPVSSATDNNVATNENKTTAPVTLESASKAYGAQAGAMIHTYQRGQDIAKYDAAYRIAYDAGMSGTSLDSVKNYGGVAYLTDAQIALAYKAGKDASDMGAIARDAEISKNANGKTGWRKGTVRGKNVTGKDLQKAFNLNSAQVRAYNILTTVAEATGIDIVLYKSEVDSDGNFIGAYGEYKGSDPGTIYIDINAGLENIKSASDAMMYVMVRTFNHEFVHFVENWNPVQYNEFRRVVFDTIDQRRGDKGYSADQLILLKMDKNPGLNYEAASREVVADAMTDILPDSNFIQELADNHKTIFDKLLEKIKEFVAMVKDYFNSIGDNPYNEAKALKEQIGDTVRYLDNIVKMFDEIAVKAVENYQSNVAVDEVIEENTSTTEAKITTSENGYTITDNLEYGSIEIKFDEKPSDAVREVLKENKFRWNRTKGVWYGKTTHETIMDALDKAYERKKSPAAEVDETKSDFAKAREKASREEKDEVNQAIIGKMSSVYPTEIRGEDLPTYKEENVNGENENNERPVLQPEPNGEGASRLLDELQAEDVQGTGEQRETVEPSPERGGQDKRDSDRQSTSAGNSRSEGTGESGDLRRLGRADGRKPGGNDGAGQAEQGTVGDTQRVNEPAKRDTGRTQEPRQVSQEEKQAKKEKLKETVSKQIEQKSKEAPKGSNYVIGDSLNLPSGEKTRFKANIDAIRLIKQLETEGRYATAAEQEVLSKYVGWGGLSNAFGELRYNRETRKSEMVAKPGWENEFAEFRQLVTDGIITEEEYKAMSASTKNAHYTSIEVIKAMYDGLKQLGFIGGRMLEPSSGVGNFVGAMPADMSSCVNSWTMVELDRITGQIAKYLYPNADVRIQGFETANIPDNYMDVAIGNVPFGNYGVVDRNYPKRVTKAIHNYFFAKTLDKVRPGGVVMFITSSFTMNSQDNAIRKYIADRADLLGAIRLPNTAFAGNAGTQVVTDILVLKKRADGTEYAGETFLEAPPRSIGNSWQQVNINEYFDNHPEMVLGNAALERGMYGSNSLTYNPLEGRGNLGDQIREAFKNITGKMDYKSQVTPEKANFAAERAGKKTKQGGLEVKEDGKVYRNENGKLVEVSSDKAVADRVSGLLGIRDAYRTLINDLQQGVNEKEIKQARKALNKAYDDFVKKYGLINSPKNKNAIADDPDSYSLLSLENYDPKKKTATKADIFIKDTITANKTVTHVDDTATGVIVSINRTGGIDTALIAEITGKSEESVTRELIDSRMAFKTKDGSLEAPETYLSGNVRAKLREAEALAPIDKDYQNNVDELRRVIPKDIPFNDIFVAVGTPWIPNSVYADFIAETLGGYNNENSYSGSDVTVGRTNTGEFKIVINNSRLKSRYQNTQKWGTKRKTFIDLMTALMSNGSLTVNDYIDDGTGRKKPVINKVETAAAQAKAEEISKEFQEWLWRDENRKAELTKLYNETFNALVTPKYNGKNLTVNGINAEFTLREHQANAVQRIIASGGNTLLAHKVGAGKTLEMAAAAMKLKELGIVKKPVFVVPKSLVAQWGVEFKSYFPAARLLVADEKSFTKANRKVNANRIANGDYDAVILSYEQFEKIPMTDVYKQQFYQQQIDEIIDAIAEEKAESNGKGITVKEMEKKKAQLEKKIAALTTKAKDEDNINFEELGIDSLFVDEAHNFKNLEYVTRMKNISGLSNTEGSQRAFDLYTKVRYLQQLNGGRGIVFATATPVMNSMAELYIMQKYLQSDMLEQLGLKTFDAWAKQFGEVVNAVEIKPSGQGFRVKQTFSNFRNLNELQLLFRSFSDVLTQVPGLEIPKMKGGKVNVVVCEPGQFQKDYMVELEKRADDVKNVDPSVDNMLKITSDGRKVAYTQRMIDPTLPYEPGCKLYRCCDNVLSEYKESSKIKGTQIVFCDMATPKGKSNTTNTEEVDDTELDTSSARLYDDMKAYLVKKGIPAKEIAFIHDADTDAKKKQLFADVNDGKVRVLIGSTGKMGVGMNAQKRIVAIHHLDAPWRPGDVEQRDGRAFRQKNMNEEVTKYTYVTEGSFDARLWDILDRKQHFIEQIMNGDDIGRSAEDTGNVTLSAAEVKALASGNPMIMEQVQLSNDLAKLNDLKKAYNSSIAVAKSKLLQDEQQIGALTKNIENCKEDIRARVDTYSDGKFSMKIGKNTFTDKKDAGTALASAIVAKANHDAFVTIGEFAGFELRAIKQGAEYIGHITGKQAYKFNIYLENTTYMVNHIIGVVENLENRIQNWTNALEETKVDLAAQQKLIAEPFAKQAELEQKLSRYNEVMAILNPKEEQTIADDVQYQAREYEEDNKSKKYSYEWFAAKPDMAVTAVDGNIPNNRADIILQAKQNAASVGKINKAGSVSVFVNDLGAEVLLGTDGLRHGLRRSKNIQNDANSIVTVMAGEIIKNSVVINEMVPSKENASVAFAMIGTAQNPNGDLYIVRSVINRFSNELMSMDVLYAINAKKESAALNAPRSAAKPLSVTDSTISIAKLLEYVNEYFPDILPEDVLRYFGHDSRPDGMLGRDALYQQRTKTLSNREVLSIAAYEMPIDDLTDGERSALDIFKKHLDKLTDLEIQRAELGRLYREQQFGANVDREEAAKTLNRMRVLDDQIKAENDAIFTIEEKKVLREVLKKARNVVEKEQWTRDQETLKRLSDRRNNAAAIKKYRERIRADVDDLTSWILKPDNKNVVKHVPDALKNSVIPFLSSINFASKQQLRGGNATVADKAFMEQLTRLKKVMNGIAGFDINSTYSGYADLPQDFMQTLSSLADTVQTLVNNNNGEFVINRMTADELQKLSKVVRNLKRFIKQINRFHNNSMFRHVYEAGDNSIEFMSEMSPAKHTGGMSNFLFWQQMRPAYAFERFGDGGKAIYDELRRGQAKLAFNTKEILEFSSKAYTVNEVSAWEKEVKTINLGAGQVVKMKVSQIMSLYELSKREQALGHILGEGIRVATYKDGRAKISDNGRSLTPKELKIIINQLTPRQKEVADKLQQFMKSKGGEWGNYVSMARFGENQFGEENYFPINSDGRHLQVDADEKPGVASLYALLNMGFTKQVQEKAKNRIVIYSIFDVFSNHMASMAQYNAMALPVVDALKWFNYQQVLVDEDGNKTILGSVREQMDRTYGVPVETKPGSGKRGYAQNFVINIIKAFNGTEAQGSPMDTLGLKMLHKYNRAQVAYNFRVVVQQPLAITRAADIIDYASIIRGLKLSPAEIKRNIAEMQNYSGIAAWKSLGFYDVNISRGLTQLIKHDESGMDKFIDVGMKGAEAADTITWAAMWSACKEEVSRKQHLTPNSNGFYDAVTSLFEDVIYKTQVVDSVLTKNEFMRDKGFWSRAVGSFMSEPTTTASMLLNRIDKMNMDRQRGLTFQQVWKKHGKQFARTVYVYAVGAAILAAVQGIADAFRDDDDYKTFLEKWLEAFKGNMIDELMPFNKLPILSDFYEFVKSLLDKVGVDTYGNPPNTVLMQWQDSVVKAVEIFYAKINGDTKNRYTWYGGAYKLLQGVSGLVGVPMAGITREVVTAWNSTIGVMAPSLKVKTYDSGPKNNIKYAYKDGYLTEDEATQELLDKSLVETEEKAINTVGEWEYENNYPELARKISFTNYQKWKTYGEPQGISVETFIDVATFRDDGSANPVKSQNEVWEYIDSLNISKTEKNALHLCFWKESTLKDAPWNK